MKIYTREEFLKLPAGILYRKSSNPEYRGFGELEIKGSEDDTVDFVRLSFANVTDKDLERMEILDESRPVDTIMCTAEMGVLNKTLYFWFMKLGICFNSKK